MYCPYMSQILAVVIEAGTYFSRPSFSPPGRQHYDVTDCKPIKAEIHRTFPRCGSQTVSVTPRVASVGNGKRPVSASVGNG